MKHCLIIPCSDTKGLQKTTALNLYKGALMQIINSFDASLVLAHFNILFLSAKHGLIHSDTIIEPYDTEMPTSQVAIDLYASKHKKQANKLLTQYANKKTKLFTVLSSKYQQAFDLMKLKSLNKFSMVYQSRKSKGIGDFRGRLKKIIKSTINDDMTPTLFRSGCNQANEMIAFQQANECIGTSLAFIKNSYLKQYVVDIIKKKQRCFVDNGLITAVTRKETLDEQDIFDQYLQLTTNIRGTQSLSIVIPDNPMSQLESLKTITRFKKEIRVLAKKCRTIIVFHKPVIHSVAEQAKKVIKILGKVDITLGIPCRNAGENQWRLSIEDIESLFALKRDNKEPLFNKVHFLALSEKTRGSIYQERISLSSMYGVEFSADSCRVTALFGAEKVSNRKGSIATRAINKQLTKKNTLNDLTFKNYDGETEIDQSEIWDEINAQPIDDKIAIWNTCYPYILIKEDNDNDKEEVFDNLTCAYFHDFIIKAKFVLFSLFSLPEHAPSHDTKRTEAIIQCFSNGERQPVQKLLVL